DGIVYSFSLIRYATVTVVLFRPQSRDAIAFFPRLAFRNFFAFPIDKISFQVLATFPLVGFPHALAWLALFRSSHLSLSFTLLVNIFWGVVTSYHHINFL